jgi:hypothetical protein
MSQAAVEHEGGAPRHAPTENARRCWRFTTCTGNRTGTGIRANTTKGITTSAG